MIRVLFVLLLGSIVAPTLAQMPEPKATPVYSKIWNSRVNVTQRVFVDGETVFFNDAETKGLRYNSTLSQLEYTNNGTTWTKVE